MDIFYGYSYLFFHFYFGLLQCIKLVFDKKFLNYCLYVIFYSLCGKIYAKKVYVFDLNLNQLLTFCLHFVIDGLTFLLSFCWSSSCLIHYSIIWPPHKKLASSATELGRVSIPTKKPLTFLANLRSRSKHLSLILNFNSPRSTIIPPLVQTCSSLLQFHQNFCLWVITSAWAKYEISVGLF